MTHTIKIQKLQTSSLGSESLFPHGTRPDVPWVQNKLYIQCVQRIEAVYDLELSEPTSCWWIHLGHTDTQAANAQSRSACLCPLLDVSPLTTHPQFDTCNSRIVPPHFACLQRDYVSHQGS